MIIEYLDPWGLIYEALNPEPLIPKPQAKPEVLSAPNLPKKPQPCPLP